MQSTCTSLLHPLFAALPLAFAFTACGPTPGSTSTVKEAIDGWNDPATIPGAQQLERRITALPDSGASEHRVWTGDYWPLPRGGLLYRANPAELSPIEKYDLAANNGGAAAAFERDEVRRYGNVSWSGHCNGLAAAGTMTQEPRNSVTKNGVTFSANDIKGILTELWQGGGVIVGGRCEDGRFDVDATGRPTDANCRGLNPGALHIALGNFLGILKKPLIMDRSPLVQVWNYPVIGYQVLEKRAVSAAQAADLVNADDYTFNPAARHFAYVRTRVTLVTNETETYEYVLEGDAGGTVVGGEWVGSSRYAHPDFIWRHSQPTPDNDGINTDFVRELYRASLD